MPFKPGHTLSTGRPKGSQNKTSEKIRVAIDALLEGHLEGLTEVLGQLRETNPVKYAENMLKLMEYTVPKMRSVDSNVSFDTESLGSIKIDVVTRENNEGTKDTSQ